tara:strand:- start:127 stop:438 length:312 start_codon:yes stop_codon:yes gene_type:complete
MLSFKDLTEAPQKIKWKKVSDGFGRGRGQYSSERFKWLSPDDRFQINRATDPMSYGRGATKDSNKIVWKISDQSDPLRKAYNRSYPGAASAKRAAEIIVSKES